MRAGMMSAAGGSQSSGVNSIGSGNGGQTTITGPNEQRALSAANQELLRAADAAQVDLNSRLALLQVSFFLSLSPYFESVTPTTARGIDVRLSVLGLRDCVTDESGRPACPATVISHFEMGASFRLFHTTD